MNIRSENPMPYDPANFTFSYSGNELKQKNPEIAYDTESDRRFQVLYAYTPHVKSWQPFHGLKENNINKLLQLLEFRFLPEHISISNTLHRNYSERQLRDPNTFTGGAHENSSAYLTFSHNFYWDRQFNLTWNLTKHLNASFHSGTLAEVEEPYLQVNKAINRSDYEIWKDSVMLSLRGLGRPLRYNQTADLSYTFPFERIPLLDWISSSMGYHSQYHWERGATIHDKEIGNHLQNDLSFMLNSRFNFSALYRKLSSANSPTLLTQSLTMIRQINLNLTYKTRTDLPGYIPMSGDLFGQKAAGGSLLPGLPFAFGFEGGRAFVEEALSNQRLVINQDNLLPAIFNRTRNVRIETGIEPLPGIRLDLHALHEENQRSEFQYKFEGVPEIRGGSFAMSIISLFSAFETRSSNDRNYRSAAFKRFLENRSIVASRVRNQYVEKTYPHEGFLNGSSLAGQNFSSSNGDVKIYSADVLVPAFLAAYSGRSAESIALTPFPSLTSMMPNWNLSLSLTTLMPSLQNQFTELMILHRYLSQYRIGSYNTHLSWVTADGELGFIRDAVSGAPLPSSPYNIQSVGIMESFNPLIELRATFHNNLSLSLRLNRTRSLNLAISSHQLIEMSDNDLVVGTGYRIDNFGQLIGLPSSSRNRQRRHSLTSQTRDQERTKGDTSFRNDLTLRLDLSLRNTQTLIRRIEQAISQPTSGIQNGTIRFTADYAISRQLTLRAFYDRMVQKPLVSSFSSATATSNAGIAMQINFR
jgi:hypothetical protein